MTASATLRAAAALLGLLGAMAAASPPARAEAPPPCPGEAEGAAIGGPFALVGPKGAPVSSEDLKGRPLLLSFGFASCPDVCPLALDVLSEAAEILEAEGRMVTPVFVTVDPERDTPEVLAEFTAYFHPRLIGLTGSPEQIRAAADAYKVYYEKRPDPDFLDGYAMAHTSFSYLVDAEGAFRSFFRNGATAQEIAEGVRCRIAAG